MRHRQKWTDKEIEFLLEHYFDYELLELAQIMGRTKRALMSAYERFKLEDATSRERTTYMMYRGDKLVGIGKTSELAEMTGLKKGTIQVYKTKTTEDSNIKVIKLKNEVEHDEIMQLLQDNT